MNQLALLPPAPGHSDGCRISTSWRRALLDWLLTPRIAFLAACILPLPFLATGIVLDDNWRGESWAR
jgi:hypothetical protein